MSQSRAAIVSGASKGIGAAIATALSADGVAVVVNYASRCEGAESAVSTIIRDGGHAIAVEADITDPAGIPARFDAAEAALGGVDILVNNAGVMRLAPLATVDDTTFERQVATNLGGVFRGAREAAKRVRYGGRSISVSSSVVGCISLATASTPPPRRRSRR